MTQSIETTNATPNQRDAAVEPHAGRPRLRGGAGRSGRLPPPPLLHARLGSGFGVDSLERGADNIFLKTGSISRTDGVERENIGIVLQNGSIVRRQHPQECRNCWFGLCTIIPKRKGCIKPYRRMRVVQTSDQKGYRKLRVRSNFAQSNKRRAANMIILVLRRTEQGWSRHSRFGFNIPQCPRSGYANFRGRVVGQGGAEAGDLGTCQWTQSLVSPYRLWSAFVGGVEMKMDERLFLCPFHYQLFQWSIVCAKPFDEHRQSVRTNVPNC